MGFMFLKFQFMSDRCRVLETTCQALLDAGVQAHDDSIVDVAAHVRSHLPAEFEEFWRQCKEGNLITSPGSAEARVPLADRNHAENFDLPGAGDMLKLLKTARAGKLAVNQQGASQEPSAPAVAAAANTRPPWRA